MNETTHPHLIRCLFVEDSFDDIEIVRHRLNGLCVLDAARTRAEFMAAMEKSWDIVLTDLAIGGDFSGQEAIRLAKGALPSTPIIVVTGSVDEDSAALACQQGAVDYVLKHSLVRLRMAISNAYEAAQSRREIEKRKQDDYHAQRLDLLGELSAGMIHDTNNALACILAGTELLRKRIHPEDEHILDSMLSGAKHGAELTKQMLIFARGSNGSAFKPVAADYLTSEIGQVLRSGAFPNIRSTTAVNPGTSKVLCNPTMIHQIFMNLIVNARDAMPHGGQIDITAQNVFLHGETGPRDLKGDFVMFAVRDNGSGMKPEVQAKAFEAFFTTKPNGKGTGMGLAMVKSIAEDHGGAVTVNSGPSGTTFFIYLPSADGPKSPEPQFDGTGKTVLLAEDDATMRLFITMHLEQVGYKVLAACNGPEALSFFRSNPDVDLLLTDNQMPVVSGPKLLENIRAIGMDLPVIYMTGADVQEIDPRPDGVLQKPFTREQMLAEIERVLRPITVYGANGAD